MACSLQFLLLFTLCFFTVLLVSEKPMLPNTLVLPVKKDPSTFQYITKLYMGTALSPFKLVVDLGGPLLWADCASTFQNSYNTIKSCSIQCSMANLRSCNKATEQGTMACRVKPENSIARMALPGDLAEDRVAMAFTDGSIASVRDFLFSCSPKLLTKGLAEGAKGMLGLGNTRISLPSQISSTFGYHREFFMCLSPLIGAIFLGDISNVQHIIGSEVRKSMMYTPFISKKDGYHINVKSIKIAGKKLSINSTLLSTNEKGYGGTKVSTILPYTTMESTIYDIFVRGYVKVAISMNMTRVTAVSPFGACFSSEGAEEKGFGSSMPIIDLVLQSEMVKWRIYGRNSIVKVSDEVVCLGFLDGGLNPEASIVIGGYQLEDNFLEFNLGTAMLGFSSLTRCSELLESSSSIHKDGI